MISVREGGPVSSVRDTESQGSTLVPWRVTQQSETVLEILFCSRPDIFHEGGPLNSTSRERNLQQLPCSI